MTRSKVYLCMMAPVLRAIFITVSAGVVAIQMRHCLHLNPLHSSLVVGAALPSFLRYPDAVAYAFLCVSGGLLPLPFFSVALEDWPFCGRCPRAFCEQPIPCVGDPSATLAERRWRVVLHLLFCCSSLPPGCPDVALLWLDLLQALRPTLPSADGCVVARAALVAAQNCGTRDDERVSAVCAPWVLAPAQFLVSATAFQRAVVHSLVAAYVYLVAHAVCGAPVPLPVLRSLRLPLWSRLRRAFLPGSASPVASPSSPSVSVSAASSSPFRPPPAPPPGPGPPVCSAVPSRGLLVGASCSVPACPVGVHEAEAHPG